MFRLWQFYKDYKQDKKELEELKKEIELIGNPSKDKKQETGEECSKQTITRTTEKPKIEHCKAIINGMLYDTKKAEKIGEVPSYIIDNTARKNHVLFKTKSGRYFVCEKSPAESYVNSDGVTGRMISYYGIRLVDFIELKEIIGQTFPDLYIELFGEAEEA